VIWDGDQVLGEIRTGGGFQQSGTIAYTHGGGLDAPLSLVRKGLTSGPVTIVPHSNWRGQYHAGSYTDGAVAGNSRLDLREVRWPAENAGAYLNPLRPFRRDAPWMGSLVQSSEDASGLMYRRNRYYDPKTGRFTQEDPIGLAGGLNTYGFADGDPVSYDDPYGLCPPALCAAAAGAVLGGGIKMANNYLDGRPLTEDVGKWVAGGAAIGLTLGLGATAADAALLRVMARRSTVATATAGAAGAGRVMLEAAKQGKHIPGHNNYIAGRSVFTHRNPQGLLDQFAGKGQAVAGVAGQPGFRERINFGEVIGQVNVNGTLTNTTKGIIHYSKAGAHIVPANP
jgi:RHS repeat-associated protein